MLPAASVPVPVVLSNKLGCFAGAVEASAVGTSPWDTPAFFFSGTFGAGDGAAMIFCSSLTLILSALSANVSLGAWKFAMFKFPLAFVEPREAARFVRLT